MPIQNMWSLLMYLFYIVLVATTISVIATGAILIGINSVVSVSQLVTPPTEGAVQTVTVSIYAALILVPASLLASAPLIEWWYNFLFRIFKMEKIA